ncbi:hypothetical protein MPOR_24040 [Mycolicibacterium poriferae]|uniref:Uncharacterized protein n=1 Tax=Mycolicibacterium poriferae TaxID=39694 RepID=A0A6N4VBE6_9MYCO|nr:hypothetical protein MPOR_24040 [Mycolicibacterium poriferae]
MANTTGAPPPTSTSVTAPAPNRSQRCHSEVNPSPVEGSNRATKICLFRFSAVRYSTRHSSEASQRGDNRQITASHRALACRNASFHREPARNPVSGSTSKKISLANGGSCNANHRFNATAARTSRLE